jgi:hypothetical protein
MPGALTFSLRLPFALALLLASLPTGHAAPAYEGRWGDTLASCRNTRAGNTDHLPIVITRRSIETFAASCRVLSVKRQGTGWRLRTNCRDEGQTETEPRTLDTVVLRVSGNTLSMRDMNGSQTLMRCPG